MIHFHFFSDGTTAHIKSWLPQQTSSRHSSLMSLFQSQFQCHIYKGTKLLASVIHCYTVPPPYFSFSPTLSSCLAPTHFWGLSLKALAVYALPIANICSVSAFHGLTGRVPCIMCSSHDNIKLSRFLPHSQIQIS